MNAVPTDLGCKIFALFFRSYANFFMEGNISMFTAYFVFNAIICETEEENKFMKIN